MPFTPFHMGPALAVKALAGERFSILMFGLAQVAIDVEPGLGLVLGWDILHGWTHTYAGATAIGALVLVAARPLAQRLLDAWNGQLRIHGAPRLAGDTRVGWGPAAAGAFLGTYSHVALDSFMHADMRPLAPFADSNGLLGQVSISTLHAGCVAAGLLGALAWLVLRLRRRHPGD